jgi:Holliday junction resolvasome RuvABC ATP-dependent DNA helicase subunit
MRFFKKPFQIFKRRELFSEISGHEDIKWTLQKVIDNEEPVHVLLVGPPGLGKTRFLKAIEKEYPDLSYFALASGSTGAGMINQCFEDAPRFLLIDEIEDLRTSDQATLLSLLQDGCLVETKVSKTRRLDFTCSVIATCNSTKKLKEPLSSRFAVIELEAYGSLEEFKRVTLDILKDNDLAEYIAEQVYASSDKPNIRDCVRLATLCSTEQDVCRMLRVLRR